jgi:hypothetical protein
MRSQHACKILKIIKLMYSIQEKGANYKKRAMSMGFYNYSLYGKNYP